MALRIGKNKDDAPESDDWADIAAMGQDGDGVSTPPVAGQDNDDFDLDSLGGAPSDAPTGVDIPGADSFPAKRAPISPILLAAGLVFLITAVGVGAYFLFFSHPAEEVDLPPTRITRRPPKPPVKPPVKPAPVVVVRKSDGVKTVPAGKTGVVPAGAKAPDLRPVAPNKTPALAPKPNMPTPVPLMPDGVAGQAGKGMPSGTTVKVVNPSAPPSPQMKQQLRQLWIQGAEAKHRGDIRGAREAWLRMLALRPGHPGVQGAIDKLPK